VRERTPVAAVPGGPGVQLVDRDGVVIGGAAAPPPGLPLLRGDLQRAGPGAVRACPATSAALPPSPSPQGHQTGARSAGRGRRAVGLAGAPERKPGGLGRRGLQLPQGRGAARPVAGETGVGLRRECAGCAGGDPPPALSRRWAGYAPCPVCAGTASATRLC